MKFNKTGLIGLLLAAAVAFAPLAHATDTYTSIPHPVGVWDTNTGQLYGFALPGQGQQGLTPIAGPGIANLWTTAQTFTSGDLLLLGSSTGTTAFTSDNAGATNYTLHFPAANDTVAELAATQTLTNKTITSPIINGATGIGQTIGATSATSTSFTSNATLGAITGLSVPVVAGGTYYCVAYLPITSNASGGVQVAFAGANSMTATSANYSGISYTDSALAQSSTTTFGNAVGASTAADTLVHLEGTIVVNAAGNLIVQGAQNASFGTATVFLANSTLGCIRTN